MDKIKDFLNNFFQISGFELINFDFDADEKNKVLNINLRTPESNILIGSKGKTLLALEQILRLVCQKQLGADWRLFLDINNYRQNQYESLKEMARKWARQVALTKKPMELEPMGSRERRIIHLELALNADVFTESIGEGKNRHIVIKPIVENSNHQ